MNTRCYICATPITPFQWHRDLEVNCPVCGIYKPDEGFLLRKSEVPDEIRYLISGAIRENNERGITPFIVSTKELLNTVRIPQNPIEAVDCILLHLNKTLPVGTFYVPQTTDYSIAYAKDKTAFYEYLKIAAELSYLKLDQLSFRYSIGAKGWMRITELLQNKVKFDQAFVAMWFNPGMKEAFTLGIEPALKQTGYIPMKIDLKEHNEHVDDEIIAEIRKSGLLVADFTGQRAGVYFEAGFALGLGIPVIWTSRSDEIASVHFDTRQYNHIVWETPEELRTKLINRIEATLPNRIRK